MIKCNKCGKTLVPDLPPGTVGEGRFYRVDKGGNPFCFTCLPLEPWSTVWGQSNWEVFWDWLHCKAEELDVLEIGDQENPLKSFDVQAWLCEMWEKFHTLEVKRMRDWKYLVYNGCNWYDGAEEYETLEEAEEGYTEALKELQDVYSPSENYVCIAKIIKIKYYSEFKEKTE